MATTTKERLDPHDRQMAAIRALIREAKRLGVETRRDLEKLEAPAGKRRG